MYTQSSKLQTRGLAVILLISSPLKHSCSRHSIINYISQKLCSERLHNVTHYHIQRSSGKDMTSYHRVLHFGLTDPSGYLVIKPNLVRCFTKPKTNLWKPERAISIVSPGDKENLLTFEKSGWILDEEVYLQLPGTVARAGAQHGRTGEQQLFFEFLKSFTRYLLYPYNSGRLRPLTWQRENDASRAHIVLYPNIS